MKITCGYFGTPDFSARFLERLLTEAKDHLEVTFVVTQPDKPVGRKQMMTESPVKIIGKKYALPIYENVHTLPTGTLNSCDLALVFAYGRIIKKELLGAPEYGFWNIHPSLLPQYRGASPVVYPLVLGDKETGVTLIKMDEQMDRGPIITQKKMTLEPDMMHNEVLNKLADMSYYILIEAVKKIVTDSVVLAAQAEENATYTKVLARPDGYIANDLLKKLLRNENISPKEMPPIIADYFKTNSLQKYSGDNGIVLLWNLYRSLHPWPGIWTEAIVNDQKKRLKIVKMSYDHGAPQVAQIQLEGKNPMPFLGNPYLS